MSLLMVGNTYDGVIKTYQTDNAASSMAILGTSTLHDWEMQATNLKGTMHVDEYSDSLDIKDLELTVPVEALKSGKSAMDKNAYKALKVKKYQNINYKLIGIQDLKKVNANTYKALSRGNLTIAGQKRTLRIPITIKTLDQSMKLSGSVSFNMSDFEVEPPSFMMGAVTTGDKITINFSINYNN